MTATEKSVETANQVATPSGVPAQNSTMLRFSGQDIPSDDMINACVHCGLCLSSCPTYRETGLEMSSPRGRILLMKAVSEGDIGLENDVFQEQMGQCLNCRACEAVCPSGVQYGAIVEASRAQLERVRQQATEGNQEYQQAGIGKRPLWQRGLRLTVFKGLFNDMRLFRTFSAFMRLYQNSGLQWLARKSGLLKLIKMDEMESMLPAVSPWFTVPEGQVHRAQGERRYRVGLLSGCIMSTAFVNVHEATTRVLQRNGCEVVLPPGQGCCGALHTHSGDLDGGRELAQRNIVAFEQLEVDAIIVNAAGCGSTLKDYDHLLHHDPEWSERAAAFKAKIKDIHEFLAEIDLNEAGLGELPVRVTYQEPCHLAHAQRITAPPRVLLNAIPGLELREMQESSLCCGSAGVYNITQPEMAASLGERKVRNALATEAEIIATANPGCAVQLVGELRRQGKEVQVRYIIELLDESYKRGPVAQQPTPRAVASNGH